MARPSGQIDAVLLQSLVAILCTRIIDFSTTSKLLYRTSQILKCHPVRTKGLADKACFSYQSHEDVLGRHVGITHLVRLAKGIVKDLLKPTRYRAAVTACSRDLRLLSKLPFYLASNRIDVDTQFFQDRSGHAFVLLEKGKRKMLGVHRLVLMLDRNLLRRLKGVLGL